MSSLYVTEFGSTLKQEQGRLVVAKGDIEMFSAPVAGIESVVVMAGCGITPPALGFLLDHGVDLLLLTPGGRYRGRLSVDESRNVALRRQQYRRLDDEPFRLAVAKSIVAGKIANCRVRCREMASANEIKPVLTDLQQSLDRAAAARSLKELRGIEGAATKAYFSALRLVIRAPWTFEQRRRRPAPDPVNGLISLLSTCLMHSCHAAIEIAGLDPHGGFLHEEHYGRISLALDLMEEFRPILADATALTLLNKRIIRPEHYESVSREGAWLTKDGWRIVMRQWSARLQQRITPIGVNSSITYVQVIEQQARQLRALIEGKTERYVPFQAR